MGPTKDKINTKQYDRQIRLWGLEAQRKLVNSHVLVLGLDAINVELAKNLILAGVPISLCDDASVTREDLCFNAFVRDEDIGLCKAEATKKRLQIINRHVEVTALGRCIWWAKLKNGEIDQISIQPTLNIFSAVSVSASILSPGACRDFDRLCREIEVGVFFNFACGTSSISMIDLHSIDVIEKKQTSHLTQVLRSSPMSPISEDKDESAIIDGTLGEDSNNVDSKNCHRVSFNSVDDILLAPLPSDLKAAQSDLSTIVFLGCFRLAFKMNTTLTELFENSENKDVLFNEFQGEQLNQCCRCFDTMKTHWKKSFILSASVLAGIIAQNIIRFCSGSLSTVNPQYNIINWNGDESRTTVTQFPKV